MNLVWGETYLLWNSWRCSILPKMILADSRSCKAHGKSGLLYIGARKFYEGKEDLLNMGRRTLCFSWNVPNVYVIQVTVKMVLAVWQNPEKKKTLWRFFIDLRNIYSKLQGFEKLSTFDTSLLIILEVNSWCV